MLAIQIIGPNKANVKRRSIDFSDRFAVYQNFFVWSCYPLPRISLWRFAREFPPISELALMADHVAYLIAVYCCSFLTYVPC